MQLNLKVQLIRKVLEWQHSIHLEFFKRFEAIPFFEIFNEKKQNIYFFVSLFFFLYSGGLGGGYGGLGGIG